MPLNLASPGIVVREVDLTSGRIDPTSNSVGALAAPFAKGPVEVAALIETENDLLNTFGQPYSSDKHYEHWLTASSYLAYGGVLRVIRVDDTSLKNGFAGVAANIKIKSEEHYNQLGYDENTISGVTVVARNPGSWSNGIKVALIDGRADQIITGINTESGEGSIAVGYGVTQAMNATLAEVGGTSVLDGYLKGIVTEIGVDQISVKVLSYVDADGVSEKNVDYQQYGVYKFSSVGYLDIHQDGSSVRYDTLEYTGEDDWFNSQSILLSNGSSISWAEIADNPGTSKYAEARGSRFDEIHIAVIDDLGKISGNAGTILEKHLSLSKAKDAEYSVGSPSYWRKYLASNSRYIFGGSQPANIVSTGYEDSVNFDVFGSGDWNQNTDQIIFDSTGANTLVLTGGKNYDGGENLDSAGALNPGLSNIVSSYSLFRDTEDYKVDFVLMGSAFYAKEEAQAIANTCIDIAEYRKDAIAFVSPYRGAFLNDTSVGTVTVYDVDTITENVISFYTPVTSSSYAIFDSGYKYMYDRFNNTFRYVPLNGDIAGTCARNDIAQFPWFSPAGTARGAILNAVKLAYNPGKRQRDLLYSNRINPVIFSPGAGIVLFGDKTGFGKASAFDRINVRRLFIYLETAISAAAKDQLFEFNDEITRTNFVNIIEPFLRDVQSKRGIFDYVVVCDETNNTAAVIDNNEFVADIYIKPARSINFIGLTFVATRTGVAFEEVLGNV